jgi:hypothetical protein
MPPEKVAGPALGPTASIASMPAEKGGRHRRGKKTQKRYRKGRLATQRKFRGGVGLLGKLGEKAAQIRNKVGEKVDDFREAIANSAAQQRDAYNTYNADYNSIELIKQLNKYFKGSKLFQELKKKEGEAKDGSSELIEVAMKPLEFDFTKSQYYSPEAWNRMIAKLREFLRDHPFVPPGEVNEVHTSFNNLEATRGRPDLPYYDLSNVELAISKMIEFEQKKAEAERQAAEAERQAAEAERQAAPSSGKSAEQGAMALSNLGWGFGGRHTRTKRSKGRRYTRRR